MNKPTPHPNHPAEAERYGRDNPVAPVAVALVITLTDEDVVRLRGIEMDRDEREALTFIRDRILPEVRRRENSRMKGTLDGGTGRMS